MIDKIFGALEDIYFTVITEPSNDDDNNDITVVFSDNSLNSLMKEFKQMSQEQMYIGKSGNQFKLLKLATLFLNYMMYEDDGVITSEETNSLNAYIKNKLSLLTISEQNELKEVFNIRIKLEDLKDYIMSNSLPCRSIDMILDKIIDHMNNQPRYFTPLEQIYAMMLSIISNK